MEQIPHTTSALIEEDEIDLRELGRTIGKHKKKLIAFTLIVTLLSGVWTLTKPNIYHSQAVLVPQGDSASSSMGGLGALAGLAGVDVGGGGMTPDGAYQLYLDDFSWMRTFLIQTKLFEKMNRVDADKNYRFALGTDRFYRLMKRSPKKSSEELTSEEREAKLFQAYKKVKGQLIIASDKKTSVITLGCSDPDPVLAKEIVMLFLTQASNSLRMNELSDMEKKITYYDKELQKTNDLALKTQLSQLMSGLIQKKVLAQSSDYYNVKMMTAPSVAYEKDKEGPNRGLVVVVSFVTSLILGIFGIFLLEFLRKDKEEV
ncbi:MAG: Wzz/FepE/Etk N-terminal domain-containing protein [Campylobacterales bacterium]|nr:Wzz/FepE/Etk N-terminal domain-containing protein [Campylobacterales bacterium]